MKSFINNVEISSQAFLRLSSIAKKSIEHIFDLRAGRINLQSFKFSPPNSDQKARADVCMSMFWEGPRRANDCWECTNVPMSHGVSVGITLQLMDVRLVHRFPTSSYIISGFQLRAFRRCSFWRKDSAVSLGSVHRDQDVLSLCMSHV